MLSIPVSENFKEAILVAGGRLVGLERHTAMITTKVIARYVTITSALETTSAMFEN